MWTLLRVSAFHFVSRATHRHLWILCPFLEDMLLGLPVSSRLRSDSHLLPFASICGPSPLSVALLSSGEDFTGTHASDLAIFLVNEEWGKATGQHLLKWRLNFKVVRDLGSHMVCITLLAYVRQCDSHWRSHPFPVMGAHLLKSSFLLNGHPCLGCPSTKQMRTALKLVNKLFFLFFWPKWYRTWF